MEQRTMDRRSFVMGSFGFGMAVLGGGMLAGCAASEEPAAPVDQPEQPSAASPEPEPEAAETPRGGRALVAVFSYSGTTLSVAERIAEATGADLFHIETSDVRPETYDEMTAQVQREQDEGYLPPLATTVENWADYDTVYLGHPIWWGQLPHVMRSFLAEHDLTGKTVAPFSTSSSSGNAAALDALRELFPGADVREALHLTRGSLPGALEDVQPWADRLGLS